LKRNVKTRSGMSGVSEWPPHKKKLKKGIEISVAAEMGMPVDLDRDGRRQRSAGSTWYQTALIHTCHIPAVRVFFF
jgi:hypothetical protein